jgi:hypothetical protein
VKDVIFDPSRSPRRETMCSEAVPLRSSDDRVCQIVMGLTRRSASKLWEIPKLVCTTHHVCTHTSRKRNMYQSITCVPLRCWRRTCSTIFKVSTGQKADLAPQQSWLYRLSETLRALDFDTSEHRLWKMAKLCPWSQTSAGSTCFPQPLSLPIDKGPGVRLYTDWV